MNIRNLIKTSLFALALAMPLGACDGGEDDHGDEEHDDHGDEEHDHETSEGESDGMDIDCATFCVQYIELGCIGTEFATDADCQAACGDWDQAGVNCRYQQMVDGMCDQAGNMGDAC